ncbi:MAG TPA: DUF4129 domain-containing protein [Galbitalea sp.]|jgi:hypothetical protein
MIASLARVIAADTPPLDPTSHHAHDQLQQELSKAEYQAARPSLLDYIRQWLENLLNSFNPKAPTGGAPQVNLLPLVIIIIAVVVIVIAFLVFGLPRINRRSRVVGSLFGDEDERDSTALRRAAERAAAAGDWPTAIEEAFRSIARGLAERTVVLTFPGTTAHGFAVRAGASFPGYVAQLASAADTFDGVRYLGTPGSESEFATISELEKQLRGARPLLAKELDEAVL